MVMMKKKLVSGVLCMCMAATLCGCGQKGFNNPSKGGTLIMATNAYAEPYEYYEGDEIVGIDVEIARAIADVLQMELKIEQMEYEEIFEALDSGEAHIGMAGIIVTDENENRADFSDSYQKISQAVIVSSRSEVESVEDLTDRIVGVPGSAAGRIVSCELEDAVVRQYDHGSDAVQALVNDAIDAVIIDRKAAEDLLSQTDGLKILEEEFLAEGCSIAVAKDNEELLDDIDKALDVVIANGTVFDVVNRYLAAE